MSNFEHNLYISNFESKSQFARTNLLHLPQELLKSNTFSYSVPLKGISYAAFLQVLFEITEICLVITPFEDGKTTFITGKGDTLGYFCGEV